MELTQIILNEHTNGYTVVICSGLKQLVNEFYEQRVDALAKIVRFIEYERLSEIEKEKYKVSLKGN